MARKKLVDSNELKEDSTDAMHSHNVDTIQMKPSNRVEAMNMAINTLGMLPQDMVLNALDAMLNSIGQEAHLIPDGTAAKNQAGLAMKPSFASPRMTESIKEAIQEIFGDDVELSEDFRNKAVTLFESALGVRVAMEREQIMKEAYEEAEKELNESLEGIVQYLDQYVTHAAEEWLKENQVAIESSLKTEITEDLLTDLKAVFESHNINIPENQVDAAEALAQRVEELEAKLNDVMNENMELADHLTQYAKQDVANEVAEGLTLSQKEQFMQLAEGVEWDEPETYVKKLEIVRNKHFAPKKPGNGTGILQEEVDTVSDNVEVRTTNPGMNQIVAALTRINQK